MVVRHPRNFWRIFAAWRLVKKWRKVDLAYAAGFIDGEGYIQIKRHKKTGHFIDTVRVGQSSREILDFLAKQFGGSVHVMTRAHGNVRQAWVWVIPSRLAEGFVKAIFPYLRVKRRQARIFLSYRKGIRRQYYGNMPLTKIEICRRLEMIAQMKQLNRRGAL
jgi:LAGLIDADG DNA endonuclease family protein